MSVFMESFVNDFKKILGDITAVLHAHQISFVVIGGAARNLHGYPSVTEDIDLLVSVGDRVKMESLPIGYIRQVSPKRFVWADPKTKLDVIYTGEHAGGPQGIEYELRFEEIDGVPVLTLKDLILYKLSSGLYGAYREKDFVDIRELIMRNNLPEDYLDTRPELELKYAELWGQSQDMKAIDSWNTQH